MSGTAATGRHKQLGYDLLNIIALQDGIDGYEIKPLSSDLISRDLEEDSLSQITQDRLETSFNWRLMVGSAVATMVWSSAARNIVSSRLIRMVRTSS